MPSISTFTSFSPAATPGGNQPPVGAGYQRGLAFWPIFFGVIFIALIGGLWKWKSRSGTSSGLFSSPKPLTGGVVEMARNRGPPVLGRPLATLRATIPPPPPPAYVHPPRYDNTPPPYGGSVRPS